MALVRYSSVNLVFIIDSLLGYPGEEEMAFMPSKLIEATVHYGDNSNSDYNLDRQSILSAETTITEESECFSERESMSSSITSVDDAESEHGVQKMEKECEEVGVTMGVSNESDGEDVLFGSRF